MFNKSGLIAVVCLLMVACGGGGGGGGAAAVPTASAVITSENAPSMAEAAVDAALESGGVGELGDLAMITSPPTSPVTAGGPSVMALTLGPETTQCSVAGTTTFMAEIADETTLSSNDSISVDFMLCDEGDGTVVDGGLGFVVNSFQGDPANAMFSLSVTLNLTNFSITEQGETNSVDGDLSLTLNTNSPPTNTISMSGSSLTLMSGTETVSLGNFSTTLSVNTGVFPESLSLSANGSVMSSEFEGEIVYMTVEPFQSSGDEYPFAGQLVIDGAEGASITVTALDSQMVRVEVDLDGDGAADETQDTTWDALGS